VSQQDPLDSAALRPEVVSRANRELSCAVTRTGPGILDRSTSFSALRYWIWRRRSFGPAPAKTRSSRKNRLLDMTGCMLPTEMMGASSPSRHVSAVGRTRIGRSALSAR
jgi:hypothetical protein